MLKRKWNSIRCACFVQGILGPCWLVRNSNSKDEGGREKKKVSVHTVAGESKSRASMIHARRKTTSTRESPNKPLLHLSAAIRRVYGMLASSLKDTNLYRDVVYQRLSAYLAYVETKPTLLPLKSSLLPPVLFPGARCAEVVVLQPSRRHAALGTPRC